MRDTTERPEGVDAGTLKLVGTDEETIYRTFKELLENEEANMKRCLMHAIHMVMDMLVKRIADILEGKSMSTITWMI